MRDYSKISKELGFIFLLLSSLSIVALSENTDTIDSAVTEIDIILTDASAPTIDADDVNPSENIDNIDRTTYDRPSEEIDILNRIEHNRPIEGIDNADRKDSCNSNRGIRILQPDDKYHGMTYGELNAEWWKWAFSMPYDEDHPLFDDSPPESSDSNEELPGKVLFLGSSFMPGEDPSVTEVDREISISPGTWIFIPLFNVEASTIEGNGETEEELQGVADSYMDDVTIVSVEIDGVPVENPEQYVSPSGLFQFGPLPDDNVLEVAYGLEDTEGEVSDSAANGYYLMLRPLRRGEHEIHFVAEYTNPDTGDVWTQDVTYTITVEPQRHRADDRSGNDKEE